jgi:hypothetical protein
MTMNTAVFLNVILDLAALAPILLLARWGIKAGRHDLRRVEARRREATRRSWEAQTESA